MKTLSILGIPMDLGQARRGVDMGPGAIRYAGLKRRLGALGYRVDDGGDVTVPVRDTLPEEGGMSFLEQVAEVCGQVYSRGVEAIRAGDLPVFLGGDHSVAVGTVGAASHEEPIGVLWVDAHGDFNTPETSPSGNIHGMPLAALTGLGAPELVNLGRPGAKVDPRDVMLIGIRDLDAKEKDLLRASGAGVYTMREIDERGMATVAREALKRLQHRKRLHVSLDLDALDPSEAPGVGTPVAGGLRYREAHLLMEILAESEKIGSMDLVEVNPILDHSNRTAELAIGLLCSAMGERIL
ncbi:MAG: arginase [Acidobacteriota bacterium]